MLIGAVAAVKPPRHISSIWKWSCYALPRSRN